MMNFQVAFRPSSMALAFTVGALAISLLGSVPPARRAARLNIIEAVEGRVKELFDQAWRILADGVCTETAPGFADAAQIRWYRIRPRQWPRRSAGSARSPQPTRTTALRSGPGTDPSRPPRAHARGRPTCLPARGHAGSRRASRPHRRPSTAPARYGPSRNCCPGKESTRRSPRRCRLQCRGGERADETPSAGTWPPAPRRRSRSPRAGRNFKSVPGPRPNISSRPVACAIAVSAIPVVEQPVEERLPRRYT